MSMNCNICNLELENLHYQEQSNHTLHLIGICPTHKTIFLPLIKDLPLKIIPSKKSLKAIKKKEMLEKNIELPFK